MKQTDNKKKKLAKTSDKVDEELLYWDENNSDFYSDGLRFAGFTEFS